jgi:HK97 family phage major capsid protein
MNYASVLRRPRGILSTVMNEGGPDLTGVMAAFEGFRSETTRMAGQIRDLNAGMGELSERIALVAIGGNASPTSRRRDLAPFTNFLRTGVQAAGMTTGDSPNGGYLVSENVDSVIQDQLISLSPLRRYATIVTLGRGAGRYSFNVNRRGTTSGWVGEQDARPETDGPNLANIAPVEGEVYANPKTSQWLLDDAAFNVENFIQTNISDEFATQEAAAFVNGDGFIKPMGFLQYDVASSIDAERPFGTLQYLPSGAASGLPTDGHGADYLISLVYGLRAPYRAGPGVAWMMNSTTASVVRKLKDPSGRFVWTDGIQAGEPSILLGYPVGIDENMPDMGTNSFPIAFGNWALGYRIVDRLGVRMLRDPFSDKPFVHFYTTKRVGGCLADSNAIKLLKCAES